MLTDATEVPSAVSGPARTLQTLAVVVLGIAMAYHQGPMWSRRLVRSFHQLTTERVATTRVEQWISQWGLLDDVDFAYAFASYDSAVAHGGHHVADAWLQARSQNMEDELIPRAAAVVESPGLQDRPPASRPALNASILKKSKMAQALRIRPGPDQPEQVLLRAEALRKAFSQAKVMRPQGELTPERYAQWQDALDTLAKSKVTEAEARHDGAQRRMRVYLLGKTHWNPWTEFTVSCRGWQTYYMQDPTHRYPRHSSSAVGRQSQWIGCWIAATTGQTR